MEWEPRLDGLLMNVLYYQLKDDIPTELAAFERLLHRSQPSENLDDDTKTDVTVPGMEDMRAKANFIRNSARIASWTQPREEILETTRAQQYTDCNPEPMQIGVQPKSKGKGEDSKDAKGRSKGKDTKNESSKKMKADDLRRCCCCQKTGHVKSGCKSRLKDLADAEGKPVAADSHPNDTAAVVLLQCSPPGAHAMTCHMATPCVEKKTLCEDVEMRPEAESTAPTGTERVKHTKTILTCETFLMIDTCVGGGICPRGSDRTAQKDTTAATVQLVTAPDDPAHGHVGKTHYGLRDGRKLQVRHDEGDVSSPIVSIGETSQ